MNDPNGMFYKDGVWHLYFQYNPYGSMWGNMTWGHSVSRDLIHWTHEPEAVLPDALGTVFSGSAIVDSTGSAGFGKNAVVAMYTSARENQTQSLAYSNDNGKTFTKYEGNPVLTAKEPDFRDPKMLWNDDTQEWNLVMATGQKMNFYSSKDLKQWKYESSFGEGYGCHKGVWECPDLLRMPNDKWVLVCNINPGGPYGGSATQYFVGKWDGHKFTCESSPETTKWMDYGKDHYATVTFSGAPNGRHVALAWMSNWQYAAVVPTHQYRSSNSVPRDLGIFTDGGEEYLSVKPSPEVLKAFNKPAAGISEACMVEVSRLRPNATIELANGKGERVVMRYNASEQNFSFDRLKSGQTDFSDAFPSVTIAPTHGRVNRVLIFIDKSSIEVFDADGKFALTNLVFPTSPYNRLSVKGGKTKIRKM
jgi:fructan beta-fructosidase